MPDEHAKLSPSSAYRWMECPGSIRLCEGIPSYESPYAAEGTAAHALAEQCLNTGKNAQDFMGGTIEGYEVTQDMADAVQEYVDLIREEKGNKVLMVEQPFKIDTDLWGTNDACILEPWGVLDVYDYKHGAGKDVDVFMNSQLMIYALGAIGSNNSKCFESVRMTIVQPRTPGETIKRWEATVEELMDWREKVMNPAVIRAREAGIDPEKYLKAGEHCQFCDALPICPQVQRDAMELAKTDFSGPTLTLPNPETLGEDELGKIIAFSKILANWAKEAKAYAQRLLESGVAVPGYKLVAKKADRKIIDEEAFIREFYPQYKDQIYKDPELKGITDLEKLVGKKAFALHTHKPETGVTMAPESDKREAVASSAQIDFAPPTPSFLA